MSILEESVVLEEIHFFDNKSKTYSKKKKKKKTYSVVFMGQVVGVACLSMLNMQQAV